jgi:hypothetical protein
MTRSKLGAVGDTANAGSDKLDAAGVIGSRCKALAGATDPGGRLARPGVVSRIKVLPGSTATCSEHGLVGSMGRRGNPNDNAKAVAVQRQARHFHARSNACSKLSVRSVLWLLSAMRLKKSSKLGLPLFIRQAVRRAKQEIRRVERGNRLWLLCHGKS